MLNSYSATHFAMTALLPFCLALGWSGVLMHRGGGKRMIGLAELGIGLGFLGGFIGLAGGVPFVDDLPNGAIGEVAAALLPAGLALGLWLPGPRLTRQLVALVAVAAVIWSMVGAGEGIEAMPPDDLAILAGGVIAALVIPARLGGLGQGSALPVLILGIVALGLAAISYCAQAPMFTGLFTILALAEAGFLVWCRPFAKRPVNAAALAFSVALLLASVVAFWRDAPVTPWGVLPLLLAFWADALSQRLPGLARQTKKRSNRPGAMVGIALLATLLGVALAALLYRYAPAQ